MTPLNNAGQAEGLSELVAYLALLGSTATAMPAHERYQGYEQLAQLMSFLRLSGWVDTMNRRELLKVLGLAAASIAVSPVVSGLDNDEQERLARAVVSPSRVDKHVIDQLDAILQDCKQQDDVLGPNAVLNTVLAQRNLTDHLLAECPSPLRPRLLSVYSDMSSSVGLHFIDLNDFDRAKHYFEQARAASHDADDTEPSVYAVCNMSYTAAWQNKGYVAIDLAAAAQNLATKADDSLLRAFADQVAAGAYATDGQHKACMAELEKAQAGVAASAGQASDESPVYWYDQGEFASLKSECLLRLGRAQDAAASARTGLALLDPSFVRNVAFCTLRLSNTYLQTGEVDERHERPVVQSAVP